MQQRKIEQNLLADKEFFQLLVCDSQYKCLRHRIYPTLSRCRLCDAKFEAKGRFEYARRIFIRGNYGY